jgi:hypothetical protein
LFVNFLTCDPDIESSEMTVYGVHAMQKEMVITNSINDA